MIHYFTCPKCKLKIRLSTPKESCFWCDGNLQLPMPYTPDAVTRAHPEGYIPPRPTTKGNEK